MQYSWLFHCSNGYTKAPDCYFTCSFSVLLAILNIHNVHLEGGMVLYVNVEVFLVYFATAYGSLQYVDIGGRMLSEGQT
jgi:hypothetical protein